MATPRQKRRPRKANSPTACLRVVAKEVGSVSVGAQLPAITDFQLRVPVGEAGDMPLGPVKASVTFEVGLISLGCGELPVLLAGAVYEMMGV